MNSKWLLIGGQALVALGSDRKTEDTDYLIFDKSSKQAFSHDTKNNYDFCNANGNKLFAAVWQMEKANIGPIASPQALLELKAYSFIQNCLNGHFRKADAAEYDIKFLVRQYNLTGVKLVQKFVSSGELSEVNKIIASVRR